MFLNCVVFSLHAVAVELVDLCLGSAVRHAVTFDDLRSDQLSFAFIQSLKNFV